MLLSDNNLSSVYCCCLCILKLSCYSLDNLEKIVSFARKSKKIGNNKE